MTIRMKAILPWVLLLCFSMLIACCSNDENHACEISCPDGTIQESGSLDFLQDLTWYPAYWCEKPDGTKHGPFCGEYVNPSRLMGKGQFCEGSVCGSYTFWWANGQIAVQGMYNNDTRCGHWTWWDSDGNIEREEDYDPC